MKADDAPREKAPRSDQADPWEAHRLEQMTLGVDATPAQRLRWLEEMIVLAHRTGALPRTRRPAEGSEK
ncbi:MAG TPA: hypothetical protein DIT48_00805 [Actinobacteria bacterium]|jgi:hypothetical protein|nr:hypothetical protein [Actinomycetota bacterium]